MKSISKIYVWIIYALWFIGAIVCAYGFFSKMSLEHAIVNFVGAGIVLIALLLQFLTVKCPYCGSKKAGRAVPVPIKKHSFKCPDCHKEIEMK